MSDYTDIHMQAIEDLNGIINSLRAENEKLRAALKPFADIASKLRGDATDWSFFANGYDLRAAANTLKETENDA